MVRERAGGLNPLLAVEVGFGFGFEIEAEVEIEIEVVPEVKGGK